MAESLLGDNQTPDERSEILNKWKDKPITDVLNAKVESDLYIKSLTARFDDLSKDYLKLRDEHQASTDLKTLIETMKKERANPDTSVTEPKTDPVQTAIKPEEIRSLVRQENVQYQNELKQQENFRSVQARLKETYGEDYTTSYKQRLDQLGISVEYADELAKTQPKLFMKTFDLDNQTQRNVNTLPHNQHRPSFTPHAAKRDWNYYQEMKKTNPKMYLDPKIAIQMHNDAIELGDAFGMPQD